MKNFFVTLAVLMAITSCAAGQLIKPEPSTVDKKDYRIVVYSGGEVVEDYWLHNAEVYSGYSSNLITVTYKRIEFSVSDGAVVTQFKDGFPGPDRIYIKGIGDVPLDGAEPSNPPTQENNLLL